MTMQLGGIALPPGTPGSVSLAFSGALVPDFRTGIYFTGSAIGIALSGVSVLEMGASGSLTIGALTTAGYVKNSGGGVFSAQATPIPIADGGSNATSMANTNGVVYYDGTKLVATAQGPANSILAANAGAPSFSASPTIGSGLTIAAGGLTVTAGGITVSAGQTLLPNGTAAAPSLAFSSETGLGWFRSGLNTAHLVVGGVGTFAIAGTETRLRSTQTLAWASGNTDASVGDTILAREAANTLAQRNGTNAQTFNLYNAFTDASNFEVLSVSWVANVLTILTTQLGTGANRTLQIGTNGGAPIQFVAGGTAFWEVPATTGNFRAVTDNSRDIGASGANRPRNLYVGSTVFTTAPNTQTGLTYTVAATDNYLIANAAGTQTLTLPTATAGRALWVRTIAAQLVVSASSNVVPLAGGAASTSILAATAGKWALLVADGTNWQITAAN